MRPLLRHSVPEGLFEAEVHELHDILGGPAMFLFEGRRHPPLFVSTLLHGNEHSGWLAVRRWLAPYLKSRSRLPRAVVLFVGNTAAAAHNLRKLPHQPDYNRVWCGYAGPEGEMAAEVLRFLRERGVFAAIDIHNNTGRNPHYACVSHWERRHLHLARLFSRRVVFSELPADTQTHAIAALAPAVTLECGLSREPAGIEHAVECLEACLHLSEYPHHAVLPSEIDGHQTIARLRIPDGIRFTFGQEKADSDLCLREDLDLLNFSEVPPGTELGHYRGGRAPLLVEDSAGKLLRLLRFEGGKIRLDGLFTPAMLTRNARVAVEDCLGYLMIDKPVPRDLA